MSLRTTGYSRERCLLSHTAARGRTAPSREPSRSRAGLAGPTWEQVPELAPGHGQKAPIRWDAHDRLGDAEGDHLSVGDHSPGIGRAGRQEIVGRALNGDAESVAVGVHRGLSVGGAVRTADRKAPM